MNISISYISISFSATAASKTGSATGTAGDPPAINEPSSANRNGPSQRAHDLRDLRHALRDGSLDDAKNAYAALKQDFEKVSDKTGKNPFSADTKLGKDFEAIGKALESGDLSGAKQAFRAFTHDMRSAHRAQHHNHQDEESEHQTSSGATPAATTTTATVSNTTEAPATRLNATA